MPERPRFWTTADLITLQGLNANEKYVPFARLCDQLGLDPAIEVPYAEAYPVLVAGIRNLKIPTFDPTQPIPCLRIDLIPLWLLTLQHAELDPDLQSTVESYQRECASILWQLFRPQGFETEDTLLPEPTELAPADQAYIAGMAQAHLSREQMLIERQLNEARDGVPVGDPKVVTLAQSVRRVAQSLAARTYRNEYGGVFQGLYRQFGITSYRNMPPGRLFEALEWLERWYGDIEGEPEPPPDI
ncbi:MAG: hypothetical protein NVS2B7_26960 [Herpetosiphon sp.]